MNAEILSEQNITAYVEYLDSKAPKILSEDKRCELRDKTLNTLEGFRDYVIRKGYDAEPREALEGYILERVQNDGLSQDKANLERDIITSTVREFFGYLSEPVNEPESVKSTKSSAKKQRTRNRKKGEKSIMTDENTQGLAENEVTESEQLDGKAATTETPNEQAVNEPVEATTTEPEQATQSSTPSAEPDKTGKHRGRSTIDENGEKRSEKLMLYLTPSLIGDIRDWCRLKGISCVDYITNTVKADLETKLSKIKAYRELRDNA